LAISLSYITPRVRLPAGRVDTPRQPSPAPVREAAPEATHPHAVMSVLYVVGVALSPTASMRWYICSASCQRLPRAHAAMSELYVMASGTTPASFS
jgi:hypothetical protein